MRLKRRISSIALGLIVCLISMTKPLQAVQKSINSSTQSKAYLIKTSLCDVFIREQGSTTLIPMYSLLESRRIILLDFTQGLRPESSASSQYYARVTQFYNTTCGSKKGFREHQSSRLSRALPLNQNHIIEMPNLLGEVSLSCEPEGGGDPISSRIAVSRWISDNCL